MTTMGAIDATALAIFMFEGANKVDPLVRNIRNNNPGNLRPFQKGASTDEGGYRTFFRFADGWNALVQDISYKIGHHLAQDSATLLDFFNLYAPEGDHNDPHGYAQFVCKWIAGSLAKPVTIHSTIKEIYG